MMRVGKTYFSTKFSLMFRGLEWPWIVTLDGFNTILNTFSYPTKVTVASRKHANVRYVVGSAIKMVQGETIWESCLYK